MAAKELTLIQEMVEKDAFVLDLAVIGRKPELAPGNCVVTRESEWFRVRVPQYALSHPNQAELHR